MTLNAIGKSSKKTSARLEAIERLPLDSDRARTPNYSNRRTKRYIAVHVAIALARF